ncbi:MAG: EndoU domain-containing protein [Cyclobacteriaceae bacterium]
MPNHSTDYIPTEEELSMLPYRIYSHIFCGRVSKNHKITGVHHRFALTDKGGHFEIGDIRIIDRSKVMHKGGFYEAALECWNGEKWIEQKPGKQNSFFPDDWSIEKTMKEIAYARERLTIDDWLSPGKSARKSNSYLGKLSCGQPVLFMLGAKRVSPPKKLTRYFATVFPYFD